MSFQEILTKLINKEDLGNDESTEIMDSLIEKKITDAQIGAFLISLQNKGVTSNELSAFILTLKKFAITINPKVEYLIDTCGTGGDKSNTFNISTITAFVLAACSLNVAKHGNRSVSSNCGSADVLEKLGVNISLSPDEAEKCIETVGIGFLFAQKFHPAFRNIAHIRKELGIRTVFNMMGPLLNPANSTYQVIGVYDESLTKLFAETLRSLGMKSAMVVYGSGLDEISLCGKTKITQLDNGNITNYYISPEEFGFKECQKEELISHSIEENASIFLDILNNVSSPKRDIVILNSAAGLIVSKKAKTFQEGIKIASEAISNGAALKKFEEMRAFTNDIAKNHN